MPKEISKIHVEHHKVPSNEKSSFRNRFIADFNRFGSKNEKLLNKVDELKLSNNYYNKNIKVIHDKFECMRLQLDWNDKKELGGLLTTLRLGGAKFYPGEDYFKVIGHGHENYHEIGIQFINRYPPKWHKEWLKENDPVLKRINQKIQSFRER